MQPRVVRVLRCCSGRSWKRSCGLASEQRSASAVKKALASARAELAAAQERSRSDRDNLRTAQQATKRDIKAAERMADEAKNAARAECEWRIGEMRAKMQAELREQLDALQISMEAEARRADAAEAGRGVNAVRQDGGDYAHA